MIVRFLVPPRPEILVCRRTPFIDDAASEYSHACEKCFIGLFQVGAGEQKRRGEGGYIVVFGGVQ